MLRRTSDETSGATYTLYLPVNSMEVIRYKGNLSYVSLDSGVHVQMIVRMSNNELNPHPSHRHR